MRRPTPLIACAAVGVLLFVCSPAVAIPPLDGLQGSPRSEPTLAVSTQPLPVLVPPPNDAFSGAVVASSLPFSASLSTVEATPAVDDPFCFGTETSVWYSFTPAVSSPLTADTFGSDYDTLLSAYTGTQGALTQVACNDDTGFGLQSRLRFPVTAGTTYYFMVAGVGGGNLVFTLDAAPLPLIPLRTSPAQEVVPAADGGHLTWSQFPRRGLAWVSLYMQSPGGPRVRVNRSNTHGWSGGFDGDTFVYQEARGRQSNLQLYDVPTGVRSVPQSGVNTLSWEWRPTLSGDQLHFGRSLVNERIDQVLLRNLTTGGTLALDRIRWRNGFNFPGQVNGNYAVWARCTVSNRTCNVFMHDIAAVATTMIGNPGRQQYAPSVTSDGTLYFARSRRGCGASVQLVRRPLGGPSKVIAALAPGRDVSSMYALENADASTTVLFGRIHCVTDGRDVLSVLDP
jgi:hypothetical protein